MWYTAAVVSEAARTFRTRGITREIHSRDTNGGLQTGRTLILQLMRLLSRLVKPLTRRDTETRSHWVSSERDLGRQSDDTVVLGSLNKISTSLSRRRLSIFPPPTRVCILRDDRRICSRGNAQISYAHAWRQEVEKTERREKKPDRMFRTRGG